MSKNLTATEILNRPAPRMKFNPAPHLERVVDIYLNTVLQVMEEHDKCPAYWFSPQIMARGELLNEQAQKQISNVMTYGTSHPEIYVARENGNPLGSYPRDSWFDSSRRNHNEVSHG